MSPLYKPSTSVALGAGTLELDSPPDAGDAAARRAGGRAPAGARSLDLVAILTAVDETAYHWDMATDRIDWESNATSVLGIDDTKSISTGSGFQFLVAAEHLARRQAATMQVTAADRVSGVPYRLQYRFQPRGRRSEESLWLEDHGRWWPGPDGQPVMARGVIRVITERYWEEQRLLYRSDHDELTGQLNRVRLTEALGTQLARAEAKHEPSAFLMAAVTNLAVINETFGFEVGDEVIAATARVIRSKLRGGDTIGRYSSNKFGIILNDCGPGAMRIAAERFIKAVRDTQVPTTACPLTASISIGGVILPDQARTVNKALSHALHALDRAKHKRLNCFMAFEPSPTQDSARQRNVTIADEVITALDENRLHLMLQPMIAAKTGEAEIYECLLRMEQPDSRIVSAGEFMPVVEQLGLSRLVDMRTLELAVDLLKANPTLRLSLNVSSLTTGDHEWLVALHRLTGGRKHITERLIIEITETAAIHDIDQSVAFVDMLKELGCRVAIDDFGAGYTSFKNLKHLDVDMVKIDGVFVKNLAEDASDEVFIKAMIDLAQSFGMETVAEWVGDQQSADILTLAGITYLQGFHYGLPFHSREIAAHLAR